MAKIPIDDDPLPRSEPQTAPAVGWPVKRVLVCSALKEPRERNFADVFSGRRSARVMRPAPLRAIVNAVAYATLSRSIRVSPEGFQQAQRPSASAGALHPVDVALVPYQGKARVFRYNPWQHELEQLHLAEAYALAAFVKRCREVLPEANGTALVLLGCPPLVSSRYENGYSLLWRDAGALMQTLCLSAEAFELAFCPLGILGNDAVRAMALSNEVIGVGVAVVGRKV